MSKQVKVASWPFTSPLPLGFCESFEQYAARCEYECTCGKHVVAWMHRDGCRLKALYEIWRGHGAQAWARIKSLPGYFDEYAGHY